MGRLKKSLSILSLAVVLVVGAPPAAAQAAAWDCPSGYLCVWDGLSGTGGRCSWLNADNDWYSSPNVCSWARNYPVRSVYNRGTSTAYDAVILYGDANYQTGEFVIAQGEKRSGLINGYLRSHKWRLK
ncbi:peptidase inhibitor family I36 protein [Micromonospora sp. NPDC049374]|uniref:peptidase inhibitor family I36 protein n=1 Tax=Micromonospora sp. NPDC049374 TaxID=3154352 RepID=UPI00343A4EB0